MRAPLLLFFWATLTAQTLEKPTAFLVKLADPIGGRLSKPGQKVGAVIISPETFLGGRLEGTIREGAPGVVVVEFVAIQHKTKNIPITSVTTGFVNSIGHPSVDEQERPLSLERGALTSKALDFVLDEGSELKLQVTPVRR